MEIVTSLRFFVDYMQGKPSTHSQPREGRKMTFGEAFGVTTSAQPLPVQEMTISEPTVQPGHEEEAILLKQYPFSTNGGGGA